MTPITVEIAQISITSGSNLRRRVTLAGPDKFTLSIDADRAETQPRRPPILGAHTWRDDPVLTRAERRARLGRAANNAAPLGQMEVI